MGWFHRICLALLTATLACNVAGRQTGGRAAAGSDRQPFRVPAEFVVDALVQPGLLAHPMHASFDNRGRLFVTVSAGTNLPFKELETQLPHSIVLLEDSDGDGVFDRRVATFADKLTFPGGILWHDGALYVASPPYLWKFEDTDGDNVADRRTPLVGKFGSTGNGADLHGPFLGPDGLLYFCDGRNGHDIATRDGIRIKGRAAGVYRCRTDGTGLERVCSGGMDNPVEVAFTTAGEPLVCTNIVEPNPRRDAILYAIDGGVYPHDVRAMAESPGTGAPLPLNGDLGWCAVSSLIRYRGVHLGANLRDKFFTAQFNTHKVQMHECVRKGAGFEWVHSEFLTTDDADFHPTCVREHPDGSLLVVDTGGWFRIGCPASQLAKPEIPGGIYRIRHRSRPLLERPHGNEIDFKTTSTPKLAALLDDPRWTVRDRATAQLADRMSQADVFLQLRLFSALRMLPSEPFRHLIWALARSQDDRGWNALCRPDVFDQLALRTDDAFPTILVAAAVFKKPIPLGKFGEPPSFSAQWHAVVFRQLAIYFSRTWDASKDYRLKTPFYERGDDPMLLHAGILAMCKMGVPELPMATHPSAPGKHWPTLTALNALELTADQRMSPQLLLNALDAMPENVRTAAQRILLKKPRLGGLAQARLSDELRSTSGGRLSPASLAVLESMAATSPVQDLMAIGLTNPAATVETKLHILDAASTIDWKHARPELQKAVAVALGSNDPPLLAAAIAASPPALRVAQHARLLEIAAGDQFNVDLRLNALSAALDAKGPIPANAFDFCVRVLAMPDQPMQRKRAAAVVAKAQLAAAQLLELTSAATTLGPFELPELLKAFENCSNGAVGDRLAGALLKSPGRKALSVDVLERLFAKYPDETRERVRPLLAAARSEASKVFEQLAMVAKLAPAADRNRGKQIFFSNKTACAACHKVEGQGGDIGPDLSKIGGSRASRDLIEAVVLPSQSIVRGYEPVTVALTDGSVAAGIIRMETPTMVHLALADRTIRKLPRASIEQLTPSATSIMPQGIDGQLTPRDLADLVAYLASLK